ncbi:MAG: hypothetical protein ACRD2L_10620, partial [Terriglobia bacterium]
TSIEILQRKQDNDLDLLRSAADVSIPDLATGPGAQKMVDIMTKNGMTRDQAVIAIARMWAKHGLRRNKGAESKPETKP